MFTLEGMRCVESEQWSLLGGFTFNANDVANMCTIDGPAVEAVLSAFTLPAGDKNVNFRALQDFNVTNTTPLLKTDSGEYVLFQWYSLVEALYESPFYWMGCDKKYEQVAMRNRGRFTEEICRERLEAVFGKARVHTNVDILQSKGSKVGEIDILVLFGDRAIVVQAKSKRLTLEARRGNDGQIRDDFKKSVQDAYDQGLLCSRKLTQPKVQLRDATSRRVTVPRHLKEIYIFCVVCDHYPALAFQVQQFLKCEGEGPIQPPLVLDIFALDAIAEMLQSPLRFLSYINRRISYASRVFASHETMVLSYHLRRNLWLQGDLNVLWLSDDISADLDVAMAVRRDGLQGKDTPDGVLTRFTSTAVGRMVAEIDRRPDPRTMELGLFLLTLSEKSVLDLSTGIRKLAQLAQQDHKNHDLSMSFESSDTGITIHFNDDPVSIAAPRLQRHCELRKYAQKRGVG